MKFLVRTSWSFADKVAACATILGVFLFFASPFIGRAEGILFPTVRKFTVDYTLPVGVYQTRIGGSFELVSTSCNFIAIEWFLVGPSREVPVGVEFENGNRVREGGLNEYGPWLIEVPPAEIHFTRADVVHQCPLRPWRTVTAIFPE
tara:strand:+ start:11576 stop:12016 length:441 start_codon:yes stop_codon:yes gene_type:complete